MRSRLESLRGVIAVSEYANKFKITVESVSDAIPSIADFARLNSIRIVSINTVKPSLEDAFVKLTGLNLDIMHREKEGKSKSASCETVFAKI